MSIWTFCGLTGLELDLSKPASLLTACWTDEGRRRRAEVDLRNLSAGAVPVFVTVNVTFTPPSPVFLRDRPEY